MLTQERLKQRLHYDPETGIFRWRVAAGRRVKAGDVAGCNDHGYIVIRVDSRNYGAHRLAVLYMTGAWPEDEVDHKDLNRANNRWTNLREATGSQNCANKRPYGAVPLKGVRLRSSGKYEARFKINGKQKYLGHFPTAEEAHAAYVKAANDNFKDFARTA